MRCPKCHTRFELPTELTDTGCPECLWVPVDSLKEVLRRIDYVHPTHGPKGHVLREALAYEGRGAAWQLAELGFLDRAGLIDWTQRFFKAAGIETKHVSFSVELEVQIESESDEPPEQEG
jgi:hypothetical protein